MPSPTRKSNATDALAGIWSLALTTFVIGLLFFARELLIPIALAALLTFLLAPLVSRFERWIGRVAAVLLVVTVIFAMIGGGGWVLTRQLVDLANKLPDYQVNIASKLKAIRVPSGGAFKRISKTIDELKKDLPGTNEPNTEPPAAGPPNAAGPAEPKAALAPTEPVVKVVDAKGASPAELVRIVIAPLLGPLGTTGLVLLLVIFMLLKREDLRSRLIRVIGKGRISATTQAMDDAGSRVSRYLLMQFIVNVCFGALVAVGLYFIGIPNVLLWGAFAGVLRFIPYIGSWIGAAIPVALSIAVSTSWMSPLLTLGLFLGLELINANVIEPWLYGSTTGVSSIALIVGAVFWTWLWGPVGLVLATPLTVCMVVMGRHIPKLEFLSVLLSDEEALEPHQEFYHRLLAVNPDEANQLAETFLKTHTLIELYDEVMIPVLTEADTDFLRESLDAEQRSALHRDVRELVDDLADRPVAEVKGAVVEGGIDPAVEIAGTATCRVLCLPARAERDELAGAMLTQLLRQKGFQAENAVAKLVSGELLELVAQADADAVCISVVAPSTVIQARYLCSKLRARFPRLKIVVGLWRVTENLPDVTQRLRTSGADAVLTSLAEVITQVTKYAVPVAVAEMAAPLPEDEEERLSDLMSLNMLDTEPEDAFDRVTRQLAKVFDASIALVTFVDRDRQFFKSQVGLPEDLALARSTPRAASVCGHVVAQNGLLVVEDLARDPRFAGNSMLREHKFRFYAGVPLHSPKGQPVGSLCILDVKPRQLSEREKRHLQVMAEEVNELIAQRAARSAAASEPRPAPSEA